MGAVSTMLFWEENLMEQIVWLVDPSSVAEIDEVSHCSTTPPHYISRMWLEEMYYGERMRIIGRDGCIQSSINLDIAAVES